MVHSPKGTPSRARSSLEKHIALRLIVGTQFQILFHSAHRGSFHLSLTVLVHYRSSRVFSLGKWSPQLPTGFLVSRGTQVSRRSLRTFAYGTVTLSGLPFQVVPLALRFFTPRVEILQPPCSLPHRFGLLRFRSPLLTECSLFLRVLRCFSSPGSPRWPMGSASDDRGLARPGFPIRTPPSLHAC